MGLLAGAGTRICAAVPQTWGNGRPIPCLPFVTLGATDAHGARCGGISRRRCWSRSATASVVVVESTARWLTPRALGQAHAPGASQWLAPTLRVLNCYFCLRARPNFTSSACHRRRTLTMTGISTLHSLPASICCWVAVWKAPNEPYQISIGDGPARRRSSFWTRSSKGDPVMMDLVRLFPVGSEYAAWRSRITAPLPPRSPGRSTAASGARPSRGGRDPSGARR